MGLRPLRRHLLEESLVRHRLLPLYQVALDLDLIPIKSYKRTGAPMQEIRAPVRLCASPSPP